MTKKSNQEGEVILPTIATTCAKICVRRSVFSSTTGDRNGCWSPNGLTLNKISHCLNCDKVDRAWNCSDFFIYLATLIMLTIVVADSRGRHLDMYTIDRDDILITFVSEATLYMATLKGVLQRLFLALTLIRFSSWQVSMTIPFLTGRPGRFSSSSTLPRF